MYAFLKEGVICNRCRGKKRKAIKTKKRKIKNARSI